ncbi:MAG: hypothetical protein P4L92_00990 [Rudaea sp.]|nr:hypothetical protein [Rudaea sp.]
MGALRRSSLRGARLYALCLLAGLLWGSAGFACGSEGHRVLAVIAQAHLTPIAVAQI